MALLAFRMSGRFAWPPTPTPPVAIDEQNSRLGAVEIHYFDKPDGTFEAALRWCGSAAAESDLEPEKITNNLFKLLDPVAWFTTNAPNDGSTLAAWITDPRDIPKLRECLGFHGAWMFEQLPVEGTTDVPEMRLPLIPILTIGESSPPLTYTSSLIVGEGKSAGAPRGRARYKFALHIATPIPRRLTSDSLDQRKRWSNFSFGLDYESKAPRGELQSPKVVRVGADMEPLVKLYGATNQPFGATSFRGFCWYGKDSSMGLIPIRDNLNANPDTGIYGLGHYWLIDKDPGGFRSFFEAEILEPAGLRLSTRGTATVTGLEDSDRPPRTALHIAFNPVTNSADSPDRIRFSPIVHRLGAKCTWREPGLSSKPVANFWVFGLPNRLGTEFAAGPVVPDDEGASAPSLHTEITCKGHTNTISPSGDAPPAAFLCPPASWRTSAAIHVAWVESLAPAIPPAETVEAKAIVRRAGIPWAIESMRLARGGALGAEASQPQSIFPAATPRMQGVLSLQTRTITRDTQLSQDLCSLTWSTGPANDSAFPITLAKSRSLEFAVPLAGHPSFFTSLGTAAAADPALTLTLKTHEYPAGPYIAQFVAVYETAVATQFIARLGALSFSSTGPSTDIAKGNLLIGGEAAPARTPTGGMPRGRDLRIGVKLDDIQFSRLAVVPVGVDAARGAQDGLRAPLLIDLGMESGEAPLHDLIMNELAGPADDRLLTAVVRDTDATTDGARTYVVLSEEPFTIYRFTHIPLSARGDAANAEVAAYSSFDRLWQFKRVAGAYRYTLPPQAVGESMDKPRRLEIHDLPANSAEAEADNRPYPDESNGLQRRAVEFSLTPPADLWVRPSDVARGYYLPEWESHTLFRQRGQLGLGTAMAAFRGEFLYGLTVGIDVARETGLARRARVAEIEALLGRPPGAVDANSALATRWRDLLDVLRRRPERLELWADDPDSVLDFAPARFVDGVSFVLRDTALHRAPIDGPTPESAEEQLYDKPPMGPGRKPHDSKSNPGPRYHPQGLSGGALWPVESRNLFEALLRRPEAFSGSIEAIALSPLGGDAEQKAEFLNGQVAIISETRNGFVMRQKVEVIGRIAPLWHRAKHVVVYERTVNHSAQFAPNKDPYRTRSRRPILRKVIEFVELLQAERSYPDCETAAPRSAAFLDRVRFNAKIINVDSAWSRDIGDDAWEIPLWNRAAAAKRPQVYPRPDIAYCSHDGSQTGGSVAQECLDPDHLHFYAEFGQTLPSGLRIDTDKWHSRLGIDFANVPPAKHVAAQIDAKSAKDPQAIAGHESRRPPVGRFMPGMRRFTWRLAPAAQKAALNASRGGKPVLVGLDSISFMRASPQPLSARHDEALKLMAAVAEAGPVDLPHWHLDTGGVPKIDGLEDALATVKRINELTEVPDDTVLMSLRDSVIEGLKKVRKDVLSKPAKLADSFNALKSATPHLDGIGAGLERCKQMKQDALALIQNKSMLIALRIREWEAEMQAEIDSKAMPSLSKDDLISHLTDRITEFLTPVFDQAAADLGNLENSVERAQAIVAEAGNDVDALLDRALSRLRQHVQSYDRSKPWSDERRKAFIAGAEAAVSSALGELEAALDEATFRLTEELDSLAHRLAGAASSALFQHLKVVSDGLRGLGQGDALLAAVCGAVKAAAGQAEKAIVATGTKIANARVTVQASNIDQTVKDAVRTALADADVLLTNALGAVTAVATAAGDTSGWAAKEIATLSHRVLDVAACIRAAIMSVGDTAMALANIATTYGNQVPEQARAEIAGLEEQIRTALPLLEVAVGKLGAGIGATIDGAITETLKLLEGAKKNVADAIKQVREEIDSVAKEFKGALDYVSPVLSAPNLLNTVVVPKVLEPCVRALLARYPEGDEVWLADALPTMTDLVVKELNALKVDAIDTANTISKFCETMGGSLEDAKKQAKELADKGQAWLAEKYGGFAKGLEDGLDHLKSNWDPQNPDKNLEQLKTRVKDTEESVRDAYQAVAATVDSARAYGQRAFDAVSKVVEGAQDPTRLASNVLKAYAAVTSAPEIAAMKADIDRLRASFDEINDFVDTTKAGVLFNRIGDELKAIGLSFPFDKIGDRILPSDLGDLEIGKVFRNFGGAKLDGLFSGIKLPKIAAEGIKLTHDFKPEKAQAWVQVDIDMPVPGRTNLFELGPFKVDFLDLRFSGQVRFETTAESDEATSTGFGHIAADLDIAVAGTSLVRFLQFGLRFTREAGLKVEFDPKKVRLNPAMQFVQDYLGSLIPGKVGGLTVLKQDGIPVGLSHDFAMPEMTLNAGTSGVSNISIANSFSLIAYPDFVLRDRFYLSRPEKPFIFSIFIIGGSGYVVVDAEYRPVDEELTVAVEFAAGGSAALALAAGPFVGQVFITLSILINYRKQIAKPGSTLTIGAKLVIAGYVSVAGIVDTDIVADLQMRHQESGQIDGVGTLSVSIPISRFWTLSARADARYKLRGGRAESTVGTSTTSTPDAKIAEAARNLQQARI